MSRHFLTNVLAAASLVIGTASSATAAGFFWIGPANGEWNNAANWSPTSIPISNDDYAIFNSGGGTPIAISNAPNILKLQFEAGAPAYTFDVNGFLQLRGAGVENLSASVNRFDVSGNLRFLNSASSANSILTTTAGGLTEFNDTSSAGTSSLNVSGTSGSQGRVNFSNSATAGSSTITINPYGAVTFLNGSTAGSANISLNADAALNSSLAFRNQSRAGTATITSSVFSTVDFYDTASAESSNITVHGGVHFRGSSTASGSTIVINSFGSSAFWDFASAGTSQITLNGSLVFNNYSTTAQAAVTLNNGALLTYQNDSTAGDSHLTVSSGGTVSFLQHSTAGNAVIDVAAGGGLKFDEGSAGSATITSDADVTFLGSLNHTTFNGSFTGLGGLVKQGTNALTVTSANTFFGGTTISGGVLETANVQALSGGDVLIQAAGTLSLTSGTELLVADLDWESGGTISLALGSGSKVTSSSVYTQVGDGTFFLRDGGFATNEVYELLTFQNAGASYNSWTANVIGGLTGAFTLRDNGDGTSTVLVTYIGDVTGTVIDNYAPPFTPLNTTFVVNGNVTAAGGNQQIGALTYTNGGAVSITDSLTLSQGVIDVLDGTGTISGGTLITPGDLTKFGSGGLDLRSVVFTGGNTTVAAGSLSVNGELVTNNLFVQQGALLGGSGFVRGNVLNNGTVAPGNSPGTLTVVGDFTQNTSGTLQIEVASAAVFDQLIVSGVASLAGTLQGASFGGYDLQYGQQVPFLQAGSITGAFDQILMPDSFRGRFLVNGGTGILLVAPESYTQVANGGNQLNVARALDSFVGAAGDRDAVSLALDLQTTDQYGSAFDQISPAFYETLASTTIELTNSQNLMLAQRFGALRLGASGFNVIGLDQAALANDRDGKSVMDAKDGKDIINKETGKNWSVWVQGNGVFARVVNVSQVPNYHFNSGGVLVGADYRFGGDVTTSSIQRTDGKNVVKGTKSFLGSSLIVGLYGGYQGTDAIYGNGGRATINSALFGGYASYSNGGFYSDLTVGGAYNGYSVRRPINFSTVDRTARSRPDGGTFSTYLDAGYDWQIGPFTLGPIVSAQYTYVGVAPFGETGADSLDLRLDQQNANSIRTNLGGHIAYTWNVTNNITVIPEGRLFWQHEYLNGERTLDASLNGGAGPGFDYLTNDPSRDSVIAGVGASANFGESWNAYFYYNADFGRQDFVSHMISGGFGWKF